MEETKSTQESPQQQPPMPQPTSHPNQLDTNSIVTIALLVFAFPIGVILMWFLTKWPKWVKITLTSILVFMMFIFLAVYATMFAVFFNTVPSMNKEIQQKQERLEEKQQQLEKMKKENEEYEQQIINGTPIPTESTPAK